MHTTHLIELQDYDELEHGGLNCDRCQPELAKDNAVGYDPERGDFWCHICCVRVTWVKCSGCDGEGRVEIATDRSRTDSLAHTCDACNGSGRIDVEILKFPGDKPAEPAATNPSEIRKRLPRLCLALAHTIAGSVDALGASYAAEVLATYRHNRDSGQYAGWVNATRSQIRHALYVRRHPASFA